MKKGRPTDPIQSQLENMSEAQLQSTVIEPLLRAKGFHQVRDTSGPNERGKDLIATKEDEFGMECLYAIQIKKSRLSGKVASTSSVAALLGQLRQAINEEIVDPALMECRKPDRLIFFTPFPMQTAAADGLRSELSDVKAKGITLIDGITLADQVRAHLPEFISSESFYRQQTIQRLGVLEEANRALHTSRPLTMETIYVDAAISGDKDVFRIVSGWEQPIESKMRAGIVSPSDLDCIETLSSGPFSFTYKVLDHKRLSSRHPALAKETILPKSRTARNRYDDYVVLDPADFMRKLRSAAGKCSQTLSNETKSSVTAKAISSAFKELIEINRFFCESLHVPFLRELWRLYLPKLPLRSLKLEARTLLYSPVPICVEGPAGAGKTTLLRHITQIAASDDELPIPIFVPLLKMQKYTEDGLVECMFNELVGLGYDFGEKRNPLSAFKRELSKGKYRLHFDGLDEAGYNAPKAFESIKDLSATYPLAPIVLTTRHTTVTDWSDMAVFAIEPFDSAKVILFIRKWFDAEPTAQHALIEWIQQHEHLERVTQTPLVTALLCTLFSADVQLPETEEELYARRLELLLGRWDTAKGITPLSPKYRKAYEFFLIDLAIDMHKNSAREIPYKEVLDHSKRIVRKTGGTVQSMVIDCISRGLLFRVENGDVSFGHLTYQEHLAAKWLAKHNPLAEIAGKLDAPWWSKTLQFYAMQIGSLDSLIKYLKGRRGVPMNEPMKCRLDELVALAPYTVQQYR